MIETLILLNINGIFFKIRVITRKNNKILLFIFS